MHCFKWTNFYINHVQEAHSLNLGTILWRHDGRARGGSSELTASADKPSLPRAHGMLFFEREGPIPTGEVGMQRSLATLADVRREELLAGEANP
jgi:hypothetical protein